MKTIGTFGVHFVIIGSKNGNEKATIYARISINEQLFEISLKHRVVSSNWTLARGVVNGKNPDAAELNSLLEKTRAQLVNCYNELVLEKQKIIPGVL